MIPQQFNEGYKQGQADARIISKEGKLNRWMNIYNLNHKDDSFIMGFGKGFYDQKLKMEYDEEELKETKERLIKSGHLTDGSKHCGQC